MEKSTENIRDSCRNYRSPFRLSVFRHKTSGLSPGFRPDQIVAFLTVMKFILHESPFSKRGKLTAYHNYIRFLLRQSQLSLLNRKVEIRIITVITDLNQKAFLYPAFFLKSLNYVSGLYSVHFRIRMQIPIRASLAPVSYTHLDVYKRQV